jgi:SAM-dependent methyltransferase
MELNKAPLLPLPPSALVGRVTGQEDLGAFEASGEQTLREWGHALKAIGKTFSDFENIVDFGCGCGRVARHLRPNLRSDQELYAVDVDGDAIAWIQNNYHSIKALKLDLLPPSPLLERSIDLVVNHSVFTHLPEDVQFAWLSELHRVLKDKGIAVLTFHGSKAWNIYINLRVASGNNTRDIDALKERFIRRGFYYVQGRGLLEQELPEYYGSAFHTMGYIEAEWFRYFRCLVWLPAAALNLQDIIVLEKI